MVELGQGRAATAAFLDGLDFIGCSDDIASIQVREPRQLSFAEGRRSALEELFERAAGRRIRVEYVVHRAGDHPADDGRELDHATRRAAESDPVVSRAMELFDARVVDVEGDPDKS
ncbi:MAG: hypothetical protein KDA21_08005 [Phycisphaerales bacterium]|nr:hypothetical protein [Phycisphaerales bacterium]